MDLIYPEHLKLYPFQEQATQETLHFLTSSPANACYNACEMGLGKTVQAIVAANSLSNKQSFKRILIICPAIMRLVWRDEVSKWSLIDLPIHVVSSRNDIPKDNNNDSIFIVSYTLAISPDISKYVTSNTWDMIILDEAHYLKNTKAKRTKVILSSYWQQSKYKLALSGTPFTTNVVDGYTLFRRMLPSEWSDFASYAEEYSHKQIISLGSRAVVKYFGIKNAQKLSNLIRSNFYVRYKKEDVLKELPDKQFIRITLPIQYAVFSPTTNTHKSKQDTIQIEAEVIRRAIEDNRPIPVPKSLAELRRVQGEVKADAIIEFALDLLEQNIPIVIFAWHHSVVNKISAALQQFPHGIITGETPPQKRQDAINDFQSAATNLIILNIQAGGVGITLTRSSTCVFAELSWTPADIDQAVSRLHRIGQKNAVTAYYFVVEKAIDEHIINTVIDRAKQFKSVLD